MLICIHDVDRGDTLQKVNTLSTGCDFYLHTPKTDFRPDVILIKLPSLWWPDMLMIDVLAKKYPQVPYVCVVRILKENAQHHLWLRPLYKETVLANGLHLTEAFYKVTGKL